jgi:hypothetical protein
MTKKDLKPDRKPNGTFAKGNKLGGGKTGSRHKVTKAVEALLEGEAEGLTRKAVEMALTGDTVALRLCLDRIDPPKKDRAVSITLPKVRTAQDTVQASSTVLDAVAEGNITPDEGARILSLLTAHKALIETCDLEVRLSALEQDKAA